MTNLDRSPEPSMVLTGDALLVGDVGRPDFAGGDAGAQFESLGRLLSLPDWVAVFPGHYEGPCGARMCGRPSTTVGFERRFNPLAGLDRETFVDRLCAEIPPRPLNTSAIEATNRGEGDYSWAMQTSSPPVRSVEPGEVETGPGGPILLDVREPGDFAAGHLPGAINLPQADLALLIDRLPRDRPILCVCQAGRRSLRAAQFLTQAGFADVVNVRGGTDAWIAAGLPLEAMAGFPIAGWAVEPLAH